MTTTYQDMDMPVKGFDAEDHICIYCGGYQSDPENRPSEHVSFDLALTHRSLEKASPADSRRSGLKDDIYDLLCELDQSITREDRA